MGLFLTHYKLMAAGTVLPTERLAKAQVEVLSRCPREAGRPLYCKTKV